ncbi:MAG TPA: M20/M25/M40 family metallo-hydrolase [Pyrinomonadaceae bacterium]|nr:M20/M25/M40 family metallo-hydrolase [Pyrinomonadaceae bacterium]
MNSQDKDSFQKGNWFLSLLVVLLLALVVLGTISLHRPPPLTSAGALTEFSRERALQHLRQFATEPHPVNSAAHDRVRDYISDQLVRQGLQPEIQTAEVESHKFDWETMTSLGKVRVQNIVAVMKGTNPGSKAVMLSAHYDSVPQSPGVNDDGAGVVTLLETVAAVKAGGSLKNDLILLFTDGEELGLLGAQAFAKENPLAKNVGVVLNFEARGSCGPVFMFETSEINGDLIKEFARSAPAPFANSLMFSLYQTLPNNTDMTIFRRAGMKGLNFAYIGCVGNYHTLSDNLNTIDLASLQHMASYALALTRGFGNSSLDLAGGQSIYFDLFGKRLIVYSQKWVLPLSLVTVLLVAAVIGFGLKTGSLTLRGIGWGALGFLASLIGSNVVLGLLSFLVPGDDRGNSAGAGVGLFAFGFAIVLFVITLAVYIFLTRKTDVLNLSAGALLWWVFFLAGSILVLEGASYLFMWPALLGVIALLILLAKKHWNVHPLVQLLGIAFVMLPCVALLTWTTLGIVQGLGFRMPVLLATLIVLTSGLLLPFLEFRPIWGTSRTSEKRSSLRWLHTDS